MGGRKDNSGGLDRWVPSLFVLHSCPLIDSRDFNSLSPGIITPIRVAEPQDPDPDGKINTVRDSGVKMNAASYPGC